jgi:hypothetical protein
LDEGTLLVSTVIARDRVIDVRVDSGLKKPDISTVSYVRGMPQKNLVVDVLRKLLEGQIKTRGPRSWRGAGQKPSAAAAADLNKLLDGPKDGFEAKSSKCDRLIQHLQKLKEFLLKHPDEEVSKVLG